MDTPRRLPKDTIGFREASFYGIERWRLVLVGALGLFALGALAWFSIPRLEEPRIEVPGMTVSLVYPGASPEDVEAQVIKPLEEVLFELDGAKTVEGFAYPSLALFVVRFEERVNMEVVAEKARGKLMSKKRDLPPEAREPEVTAWSTGLTPQMVLGVLGNVADQTLTSEARKLKSALSTIPGVAGIALLGEHKPAIRVRLDTARLARHGLSAETVVRQLRLVNVRVPGGEYQVGPLTTHTRGQPGVRRRRQRGPRPRGCIHGKGRQQHHGAPGRCCGSPRRHAHSSPTIRGGHSASGGSRGPLPKRNRCHRRWAGRPRTPRRRSAPRSRPPSESPCATTNPSGSRSRCGGSS